MRYLKNTLAVVIGCISAMAIISLGEWVMTRMYPFPAGINLKDNDALIKVMHNMPLGAYNMLLAGYTVGALVAGVVATLIAKREKKGPAIVCGVILTLLGIINAVNFRHPGWFCTANVVSLLFAYLGYLIARRKVIVVL